MYEDIVIDNLSNAAIRDAIKVNFHFDKIKSGKIKEENILDERNKKYTGWTSGKLLEKWLNLILRYYCPIGAIFW